MNRTIIAILAVAILAAAAVAALAVTSGRQYVERHGVDEYGNIRGQEAGNLPGAPGYGNGTNLPGSGSYPTPPSQAAPLPDEKVACTMDAMQCPDGSFVGRIPPSCAFAPCPEVR